MRGKPLLLKRKKYHMTEKKFGWRRENLSAALHIPGKDKPDGNSRPASAPVQPARQPDETSSEVAPAAKS